MVVVDAGVGGLMELVEVLAIVAIPTLSGAAAWGRMHQRAGQHDKDIAGKADKEVVDVKFDMVIERLDKIDRGIERLSLPQLRNE